MRLEAKHHFFKQAMCNRSFKNVALTLARHHQHYACLNHLNLKQQVTNILGKGIQHVSGTFYILCIKTQVFVSYSPVSGAHVIEGSERIEMEMPDLLLNEDDVLVS